MEFRQMKYLITSAFGDKLRKIWQNWELKLFEGTVVTKKNNSKMDSQPHFFSCFKMSVKRDDSTHFENGTQR